MLRVVEIAEDGRHLSRHHGFLVVTSGGEELGRVALDSIAAIIANAHGLTYSNNLLVALAEQGIPLVITARNHMPAAFLWPADSHHEQAGRMADQAAAGKPLKKRLWASLVSAKIRAHGHVLTHLGKAGTGFDLMARQVRSGDPDNMEAQAARRYWPLLFGTEFRRDRNADGLNAMLNYGYTILRAGTARAIMAAGLHPALGIGHIRRTNSFALVDDLMEPFRPLVDFQVYRLHEQGCAAVDREAKQVLAGLLSTDLEASSGVSPAAVCLERLALSYARCMSGELSQLDLPNRWVPFMG